jgi:hypothetical protein
VLVSRFGFSCCWIERRRWFGLRGRWHMFAYVRIPFIASTCGLSAYIKHLYQRAGACGAIGLGIVHTRALVSSYHIITAVETVT